MALVFDLSLKQSEKTVIFSDLNLDMSLSKNVIDNFERNDIAIDYDINAIGNEIVNLLNSKKYSRILNPSFGLNLESYLGESLSGITAELIRTDIYKFLTNNSGRFKITEMSSYVLVDQYTYGFSIKIEIPILNFSEQFQLYLDKSGVFRFTK